MLRARASSVVRNLARASSSGNALASSVPKAAAASGEKSGESGGRGGGGIVFPLLFFAGAGAGMYYAYDQELLPRELQEMLRSSAKRSPVATAQKPASRASPSTVSATAPTTPPTASAPAPAKTHVAADSETITSPEPAPYDPVAAAQVASSIAAAQDAALVLARQLVTPVANAEAAVAVTAAVPEPVPVPTLPPPSPWVRREALRQARERAAAWKVEALQAILRRGDGNGIGDAGADIDALSPAELRVRALKLATELHNRGRLEALHLMTSLEKNDAAWEHLFETFAEAQAAEAQQQVAAEVAAARETLEREQRAQLMAAATLSGEEAEARWREAYRVKLQEVADQLGAEAEARVKNLEDLRTRAVDATARVAETGAAMDASLRRALRGAAATLALHTALERAAPATQEVAALAVAGAGDAVIELALREYLPVAVHGNRCVPTLAVLQARFAEDTIHAVRAAVLRPAGAGAFGRAVSSAAAALIGEPLRLLRPQSAATAQPPSPADALSAGAWPPADLGASAPQTAAAAERSFSAELRPAAAAASRALASLFAPLASSVTAAAGRSHNAAGSKASGVADVATAAEAGTPTSGGLPGALREGTAHVRDIASSLSRAEDTLELAEAAVAGGDLETAADLLAALDGAAAAAARSWVSDARDRIAADRAVAICRARSILVTHASC